MPATTAKKLPSNKKPAVKSVAARGRVVVVKARPKLRPAPKKASAPTKTKSMATTKKVAKAPTKPKRSSAPAPKAAPEPRPAATLPLPPRPIALSGDDKLFLVFKDDYHARECFRYLHAETVRDLENLSPSEIIRRLSEPIEYTLDRIRLKLAKHGRSLREDADYLKSYKAKVGQG